MRMERTRRPWRGGSDRGGGAPGNFDETLLKIGGGQSGPHKRVGHLFLLWFERVAFDYPGAFPGGKIRGCFDYLCTNTFAAVVFIDKKADY